MNTAAANSPALSFDDFSLAFVGRESHNVILEHCSLEVPLGDFLLLLGRSGS